jgi:hypothetical protein
MFVAGACPENGLAALRPAMKASEVKELLALAFAHVPSQLDCAHELAKVQ